MKKQLATILVLSMTSLFLCSCNTHNRPDDDDDTGLFGGMSETTLPDYSVKRAPSHDLSRVDATETFSTINLDSKDPWGAHQDLRMAHGTIHNYFSYYALDSMDNRVNENLSDVSIISRPIVMEYPAEEEGYVIYEVTYSQIFPISTKEPNNVYMSFFSYHGVGFLDYYTGTIFPVINLSTQIDSFSVTGDVIYQGKKHHMGYYEFREQEILDSSTEQVDGNKVLLRETIKLTSTSYFIVPEGYDGIVMFVYVADDTATPLDQILAENTPYFSEGEMFGDDEDPNDYVFIGISASE